MSKNLEARIAKLEETEGTRLTGFELGLQVAAMIGYEGAELDAKARYFAGLPNRTHEQWLELLTNRGTFEHLARGPERELVLLRVMLGAPYDADDETVEFLMRSPEWKFLNEQLQKLAMSGTA